MFLKEYFLRIFSERRGHANPCRATWGSARFGQEAEAGVGRGREVGAAEARPFIRVSARKAGRAV